MFDQLSLAQLATVNNNAIEDNKLIGPKKVTKFKDRPTAVKRIEHLVATYGLALIGQGDAAKLVRTEDSPSTVVEYGSTQPKEDSVSDTQTELKTETTTADATKARKPRQGTVSREPRAKADIGVCRVGTNQALLIDVLFPGSTIAAATRHVNNSTGKALSEGIVYSTILYDLCTVKGYGVGVEGKNGEQLADLGLDVDAKELKWDAREDKALEGYDADEKRLVYTLRLPKGMDEPLPHAARKEKAETKPKKGKAADAPVEATPVPEGEGSAEGSTDAPVGSAEGAPETKGE